MSDTPYIEKPDQYTPQGNEVFCFLDSARPCTAECIAYMPVAPEGTDYENQAFSSCLVLVNLHKAGKHVTALAQQGTSLLKHLKVVQADAKRGGPPSPPPVR